MRGLSYIGRRFALISLKNTAINTQPRSRTFRNSSFLRQNSPRTGATTGNSAGPSPSVPVAAPNLGASHSTSSLPAENTIEGPRAMPPKSSAGERSGLGEEPVFEGPGVIEKEMDAPAKQVMLDMRKMDDNEGVDKEESEIEIEGPFPISSTKVSPATPLTPKPNSKSAKKETVKGASGSKAIRKFSPSVKNTPTNMSKSKARASFSSVAPSGAPKKPLDILPLPPPLPPALERRAASEPALLVSSTSIVSGPRDAPAVSKKKASFSSARRSRGIHSTAVKRQVEEARSDLPVYHYRDYTKHDCIFTNNEDEANELVLGLLAPGPLALDLEWPVVMRKNVPTQARQVAIVQLADTRGNMLVIQICRMKRFPKALQDIIESANIPKLGVNILNDGRKLFRDFGIIARNLVELGQITYQVEVNPPPAAVSIEAEMVTTEFSQMPDDEVESQLQQEDTASTLTPNAKPSSKASARSRGKIISLAKLVEKYCGKILEKGEERLSAWDARKLTREQIQYAANDVHSSIMIYLRLLELAVENLVTLDPSRFTSDVKPSDYFPKLDAIAANNAGLRPPWSASTSIAPNNIITMASTAMTKTQGGASSVLRAFSTTNLTRSASESATPVASVQKCHMRAYQAWHVEKMDFETMRRTLSVRKDKLRVRTVIEYIIHALDSDPSLEFRMESLRQLVQMDLASWQDYQTWILQSWAEGRGLQ